MIDQPKVLFLDIETAPKVAYVWEFFKQNVSPSQVVSHGHLLCAAWKWLGDEEVSFERTNLFNIEDDRKLVLCLRNLLDECHLVVAHNARKFDLPMINARCLVYGIAPPSPYKVVDTLAVAKKNFRFPSNKLEYLATVLGCGEKLLHNNYPGFSLWKECMDGNLFAWSDMRRYNMNDVTVLEALYNKMRGWVDVHPNIPATTGDKGLACPKCGSHHIQKRGFTTTLLGSYQRYVCNDCRGWSRSRKKEPASTSVLLTNEKSG